MSPAELAEAVMAKRGADFAEELASELIRRLIAAGLANQEAKE